MVGGRLKKALDRKGIIRRLEHRTNGPGGDFRNGPGRVIRNNVPEFENRNIGGGRVAGIIGATIAEFAQEALPLPYGVETEVTHVEDTEKGARYIVDVDAGTENIARARAFYDTGAGLASYLTDVLHVESVKLVNSRVLRDTYRLELEIEE